MAEKVGILSCPKKQPSKYGTTTKTQSPSRYFLHTIQPNDTLRSIAVHYNVNIDDIKQLNKLWSNDIFLKSQLKIPKTDNQSQLLNNNSSHSQEYCQDSLLCVSPKQSQNGSFQEYSSPLDSIPPSSLHNIPTQVVSNNSFENAKPKKESNIHDYLSKIDEQLSQLKTSVDKYKTSGSILDESFPDELSRSRSVYFSYSHMPGGIPNSTSHHSSLMSRRSGPNVVVGNTLVDDSSIQDEFFAL